jgi:hypothetical protein
VTEGITETNIPSIQLMVGMGIPLWRIACVRATFNKDPNVRLGCTAHTAAAQGHFLLIARASL